MYKKLQTALGVEKTDPKYLEKLKKVEAYYRIREAMNRFDYGEILGSDYGGSSGLDSSEYAPEAYAILEFVDQNTKSGKTLTKARLNQKLLQVHKKYFSFEGDPVRCSLITEHVYNELYKLRVFKLSRRSYFFHFYYKKMHTSGWPA